MSNIPRIAVFIRCHKFNLKSAHLFCELEGGVGYDLFFMTDDTNDALDYGEKARVSFNWDMLKRFNIDTTSSYAVIYYGDLMFSLFSKIKPGYSHYVMLDFDIHFSHLGRSWMETVCHLLQTSDKPIDMVTPQLGPSVSSWMWHPAAARRFVEPMASFFPVVVLSERAIRRNEAQRVAEAALEGHDERVFCEAFLPSAVHEAGYNLVDLNALVPGSYALPSFNFTLPAPFRPDAACEIGRLIHPIKEMIDAPLPPDAMARVLDVEPERGHPISARIAFEVAAELVRDQAAYRGLNP